MSKEEKKEKEKEDPHRQITPSVTGEASDLFSWLEDLFVVSPRDAEPGKVKSEPDSMPERVSLRAVYGLGGRDMGPEIHMQTWKPTVSPIPSREALVILANKFYSLAKQDVSALGRQQRYGLFAYSNLQGSSAYSRKLFVLFPGAKEYKEREANGSSATDDEDTHRDRLLSSSLADKRWTMETALEAISGAMKAKDETLNMVQTIVQQQQDTIRAMEADRRAWILATEEALSKKQEREIAAEWAKVKVQMLGDMWGSVKGLLPAIAIYATQGKVGIVEGLRTFIDGLSEEAAIALFGKWENGGQTQSGILDEDQCKLFQSVIDGKVDPLQITDFMSSLRGDQMQAAQEKLTGNQVKALIAIGKAASEMAQRNGAAA